MLIFAGIVLRFPDYLHDTFAKAGVRGIYVLSLIIFMVIMVLLVAAIVMIHLGNGKFRSVSQAPGGQGLRWALTYIDRVNNGRDLHLRHLDHVLPNTFARFWSSRRENPGSERVALHQRSLIHGLWFHNLLYAGLVIFFTYFYSAITFNIQDVADNMKKYGGLFLGFA